DHRRFHLSFHGQPEILVKVHELLMSYAFPSSFEYVFAFCHRLPTNMTLHDSTAYAAERRADECLPLQSIGRIPCVTWVHRGEWRVFITVKSAQETKWLYYLRLTLKATLHVVDLMHVQSASVLIHCSHGWDRTSQLVALAQLCLDPYFRTIQGFQVLVEKDFLAFGHPFNQGLLCLLADELYSCRFGTFLLSTQQEREALRLRDTTTSIWTYLNGYRGVLENRTFVADQVLLPTQSSLLRGVTVRVTHDPSAVDIPCANSQVFVDNELRQPSWRLSHSILSLLAELNPPKH
ncbi:hypothetical protein DYB28_005017, partial [Aphanomyces astaci]